MARLRSSVQALYQVFGCYGLRPHVAGCDHCVSPEDHERLQSQRLRELTGTSLERHVCKAVTTWGTVEDCKHFLPRLLELLAFDDHWSVEPEIVIGKLRAADWRSWRRAEQEPIEGYLVALWQTVLASFPSSLGLNIDVCLCSIGRAVDALAPFLKFWSHERSVSSLRHLADYLQENRWTLLKKGRLSNAF